MTVCIRVPYSNLDYYLHIYTIGVHGEHDKCYAHVSATEYNTIKCSMHIHMHGKPKYR